MWSISRAVAVGAVAVVTAVAAGLASGVTALASTTASRAAEEPIPDNGGSTVEDYSYPDAARIEKDYGVKLISGDGHILHEDCGTPESGDIGMIWVHSTKPINGRKAVCFKVTGNAGRLDLIVPGVYEIRGDGLKGGKGHKITAIVKTDREQLPPVTIDPDGSSQVGQGIEVGNPQTTLLQLTVNGTA
jgi:hypothetical protein